MTRTGSIAIVLNFLIFTCCQIPKEYQPPNIILIMGDDMGYSDIGAYGSEINTPNLDKLANDGIRFTQFYNTARCCPTRASLLTGLYPQQAGIGHMVRDRGTPAYRGDLSSEAVTIAEVLKNVGYSTYMSGKWHVTPYVPENPDKSNWPKQRGFDKFFGMIAGSGSFYDPRSLVLENEYVAPNEDFYATTDFTNYAVKYIQEHQTEDPYFIYVAYTAAHWPMHAPANEVAKYKGRYDKGWDVIREERYTRMKSMGLVKENWALTERDPSVKAWDEEIEDRDWEIANMEVYAAMVDIMDQGIGQIISALDAKGELDNTLIFFLQDNGACAEDLGWYGPQPADEDLIPMKPGELQTKSIPEITRDGQPVRVMKDAWPGPSNGYTAYGPTWANASNTPFREYKHWVHEGGIATPLIIHWPSKIKDGGKYFHKPAHLIDIMATCVDAAGVSYPSTYNGKMIKPMEGVSLLSAIEENGIDQRAIYWEHEGNRAVRMDQWKLVSKAAKDPSIWDETETLVIDNWELFNMELDRTETNNIAGDYPEIVEQLSKMWMTWAKRTGTLPRPTLK